MDDQTRLIVEKTAEDAARKAVKETLTSLGVDASSPLEVQRNMQALTEMRRMITDKDFQKDMMHLRKWRSAMDGIQNKGMLTAVGLVVTGVGAALWIGFQAILKGGG